MMTTKYIVWFSTILQFVKAEERLSWFTTDEKIKKSIFVPDNLPEGKEENRVLPLVFHDSEESKLIQLKCIMRGYNATNNPIGYKDARWSHPGFSDSQVNTNISVDKGDENGVQYAIWTIEINTTAADAGKKWATCEFQQGDFPLSTEFKFLIFRRLPESEKLVRKRKKYKYDLGGTLDEKDLNAEIEDDIKRQIRDHYSNEKILKVKRCVNDGEKFCITVRDNKSGTDKGENESPTEPQPKPPKKKPSNCFQLPLFPQICLLTEPDKSPRYSSNIFSHVMSYVYNIRNLHHETSSIQRKPLKFFYL